VWVALLTSALSCASDVDAAPPGGRGDDPTTRSSGAVSSTSGPEPMTSTSKATGSTPPTGPLPTAVASVDPLDAWNRWKANAPARYTMRLSSNVHPGPVDVTVEGVGLPGVAVSAVDARSGEVLDPAPFQTIDRIYDITIGEFRGCSCLTVVLAADLPVDGAFSSLTVTDSTGTSKILEFTISDLRVG
jgi:hypothetical protein